MKLLLRSMLFVTAHNEKFIEKGVQSDADALIIDFEDGVPEDKKDLARNTIKENISKGVFKGKQVFVRTNELNSEHFLKDIDSVMHEDILGIMPPKILSHDDIIFIEKLLAQKENEFKITPNHFKLAPLIETTASVLNLQKIIENNNRIVAIVFGGEDFLNDLEGFHGHPPVAFNTPKSLISMAARSMGVMPIDTPHLELKDVDGFMSEKGEAYEMGFAGSLLINPKQIELAHKCFTPSDEDIETSKRIIEAVDESKKNGAGCVMLGDKMVGPPMLRKATRVMNIVKLIEEKK